MQALATARQEEELKRQRLREVDKMREERKQNEQLKEEVCTSTKACGPYLHLMKFVSPTYYVDFKPMYHLLLYSTTFYLLNIIFFILNSCNRATS